jgi:hypothetical protein
MWWGHCLVAVIVIVKEVFNSKFTVKPQESHVEDSMEEGKWICWYSGHVIFWAELKEVFDGEELRCVAWHCVAP